MTYNRLICATLKGNKFDMSNHLHYFTINSSVTLIIRSSSSISRYNVFQLLRWSNQKTFNLCSLPQRKQYSNDGWDVAVWTVYWIITLTFWYQDDRFPRGIGIEDHMIQSAVCLPVTLPTEDLICKTLPHNFSNLKQ